MGNRFRGILVTEGVPTSDGRLVQKGALTWREPPLPLMFQSETPAGGLLGGNPHAGAKLAGNIERVWREGDNVMFEGTYDDSEAGNELQKAVAARKDGDGNTKFGVSADIGNADAEMECLEEGDDGDCVKPQMSYKSGEVLGGTACPFPALAGASMSNVESDPEPVAASAATATRREGLAPEAWFAMPEPSVLTPFTVTDDLQCYGNLAAWGTCHIGRPGVCVTPPQGCTYHYFATGATRTSCDCPGDANQAEIATGVITLGTDHAKPGLSPAEADLHYEQTGFAVADVVVRDGVHGPWACGAVRPDISDARLAELRAASLSGDWRRIGGKLELVGILAVNVPGFPVPRTGFHLAQDDEQTSLVAAGVIQRPQIDPHEAAEGTAREVAELRAFQRHAQPVIDALTPLAMDKILARVEVLPPLTGGQIDHFSIDGVGYEQEVGEDGLSVHFIDEGIEGLRAFNRAQRKKAAGSGAAMPDGSFPIENCSDWDNARRAIGRAPAGKRAAVQAHINSRGKTLGCKPGGDSGS